MDGGSSVASWRKNPVDSGPVNRTLAALMRARLIIAALTGAVVGLVTLAWMQARQLREARLALESTAAFTPEIQASTNQRPLRLRLHSLPPITIRTEVQNLDWRTLESDDYALYIANLRRIGCPEDTIRDIIIADVNKLYAARRHALNAPQPDWPFWRHPDEIPDDHAARRLENEHREQLTSLDRERRQLLHTLLGDSAIRSEFEEYAAEAADDRDLRFLAPEKRQSMAQATAEWRLAREAALEVSDAAAADRVRDAADKAFEGAVGMILTPGEREEYELRSSPLAEDLRERLRCFGSSKDEFELLFRLERQMEAEQEALRASVEAGIETQGAEKTEASALEHEARIRELLGPQRYADLERSSDPDYQTLYSLTKDHAMSPDLAGQVWGMRREVENQTTRIRQNPFLTAEQKNRALDAIRLETQGAISEGLGEPLLDDYQRQGGAWLMDLTLPTDLGETDREMVPPPLPGVLPTP